MENILEVRDLKIYYKTLKGYAKALDGINFEVRKGEILGVAGESGCGKSTLGNSLVLLKPPMNYISGEANLDNKNIFTLDNKGINKVRYEKISIIPQYAMDAFSPTKKIKVFIKDIVAEHGIKADEAFFNKVKDRLKLVNLDEDVLNRYSIELSGGMKQRLVMVISTLLDPQLLIGDEVTSALDVSSQRFVADMMVNFRDKKIVGSVMFITHDLSILYQISDRIMIMYAGQISEIASNDEIVHRPKHPYTKALIGSLPRSGVRYEEEKLESIPGYPPSLLNIGEGCRFRDRCPFATDVCHEKTPVLEECGTDHKIACWNWRDVEAKKAISSN